MPTFEFPTTGVKKLSSCPYVYIVNALVPGVAHSEPSGETMQAWLRTFNVVESQNLAIWFY